MNHNPDIFHLSPSSDRFVVAVVSDTHVPDRTPGLHPALIPTLKSSGADLIFHLGDICVPSVLSELSLVAPVLAVRGNRDWLLAGQLPWRRRVEIGGVVFSLEHGQGNFWQYWAGKLFHITGGYQINNYVPRMLKFSPDAQVLLFGHTHFPENLIWEGRLVMNPGSASVGSQKFKHPTFGLITVSPGPHVYGEIRELKPDNS